MSAFSSDQGGWSRPCRAHEGRSRSGLRRDIARLRGHEFLGIGDGHQLLDRRRIHHETDATIFVAAAHDFIDPVRGRHIVGPRVRLEFIDAEQVEDHVRAEQFDIEQADRAVGLGLRQHELPPVALVVDADFAGLLGTGLLERADFGEITDVGEQRFKRVRITAEGVGDPAMKRLDA